jgi:CSLREA domain-containing protein
MLSAARVVCSGRLVRAVLVMMGLAAPALMVPAAAGATTWQVTTTTDPGSPGCNPGACSLRAAIIAANAGSGADTIMLPAGSYMLAEGVLAISAGMTIDGAGAGTTAIDAHGASQIFSIGAGAGPVTISNLTLEKGLALGGASAIDTKSGQPLSLSDDILSKNTSGGTTGSGAVSVHGSGSPTVTVSGSTFIENSAGGPGMATASSGQGLGGAIDFAPTAGVLMVSGSVFRSNSAGGAGGAGASSGQGEGGVIEARSEASVTIADSLFAGNHTGGAGGAGTSSAQGNGGALAYFGEAATSSLVVTSSTFQGNEAGGAEGEGEDSGVGVGGALEVAGDGSAHLVNDTISANSVSQGTGGGLVTELFTTLLNDTITGNVAAGGKGGNLMVEEGQNEVKNTIFAGGSAASHPECAVSLGKLVSEGHNLESSSSNECQLSAPGDKVGVNPMLETAANNGGPVPTSLLLPESPAIDAGDEAGCPSTDARGVLRPAGAACDIGAFEIATPAAVTGTQSLVTALSATLSGTARNPDIAPGSVYFQYGTTTSYGSQTASQPVAADTPEGQFAALVQLAPETTYHFRIVVVNATGTVAGADRSFKTGAKLTQVKAPALSGLTLKPSRLHAARGKGASTTAKKISRGATITYRDSEAATSTFTVQRKVLGYVVGHRCSVRRPKSHGHPRRCTTFTTVGSFTHRDAAGMNRFRFTGRVAGRPLGAGSYRMLVVARAGATKSALSTLRFSVLA